MNLFVISWTWRKQNLAENWVRIVLLISITSRYREKWVYFCLPTKNCRRNTAIYHSHLLCLLRMFTCIYIVHKAMTAISITDTVVAFCQLENRKNVLFLCRSRYIVRSESSDRVFDVARKWVTTKLKKISRST